MFNLFGLTPRTGILMSSRTLYHHSEEVKVAENFKQKVKTVVGSNHQVTWIG